MEIRHILQVAALGMLLCGTSIAQEKDILEEQEERATVETKQYDGFILNNSLDCHKHGWPPISEDKLDTRFLLYTPSSRSGVAVESGDMDTMLANGFDSSKPTRIFTHGFIDTSHGYGDSSFDIYGAFLAAEQSNVFAVDWHKGADVVDYLYAVQNTRVVGYQIAIFAEALGQDWSKIYLAGHSLGAHVSGYAGEALRTKFGVTATRITGLDPAGPEFTPYDDPRCRLDPTDAHFVDNIHTNEDLYGSTKNMGHVDFYPNGGARQPGCGVVEDVAACSHSRVKYLYAASIRATSCRFTAYPCSSWFDWHFGGCTENAEDKCLNYMGYHATQSCPGTFYLETLAKEPYCIP